MEAIVYSKPIVYGKPIIFKSNVVFPCVSNNFRGTQLTWQYRHRHHHRHRRCLCHHNQSSADEQLKLVTIKETPATQIVKPKPKPKRNLRLVEKLIIGGIAVSAVGLGLLEFVIVPREKAVVTARSPSEYSIPCEVISSKLEHEHGRMLLFALFSTVCSAGLIGIPSSLEEVDQSEHERLAFKILGVIFMLGLVACSVEYMSISYKMDTLIDTFAHGWNWPLHLYMSIFMVSFQICCPLLTAVQQHYDKVEENDFEKGLDLKVSEAISMGADIACSPEFMSIAYTMDTLSRTVFRNWHWPYNINLAVFFILLHICCRGLRAVVDLHHKHSRMPSCEKKYFNKRSRNNSRKVNQMRMWRSSCGLRSKRRNGV